MTLEYRFLPKDINALALEMIGSFGHLQLMIDEILAPAFFNKRAPKAAKFLLDRAVKRIRDDERIELVKVTAAELDSPAELDDFKPIYTHVKDLRNKVSHAGRVQPDGPDVLRITSSYLTGILGGETVNRTELNEAIRMCRWLEAQLFYILVSTGLTQMVNIGGVPVEYRKPSRLYSDWDGNAMDTDL